MKLTKNKIKFYIIIIIIIILAWLYIIYLQHSATVFTNNIRTQELLIKKNNTWLKLEEENTVLINYGILIALWLIPGHIES